MPANPSPLQSLRNELASSSTTLPAIAVRFAANANSNASHNTYLGSYSTEALSTRRATPPNLPRGTKPPPSLRRPHLHQRLLRRSRHHHHLRLKFLRPTQPTRRKKLLGSPAPPRLRSHPHRQNPPPPARLRCHRRKPRLRRLPPTPRPNPPHRRLLQRRRCQRAGRLSPRSHRHRHRRLHPHPRRPLRPRRLPHLPRHAHATAKTDAGPAATTSPNPSTPSASSSATCATPPPSPAPSSTSPPLPTQPPSASAT